MAVIDIYIGGVLRGVKASSLSIDHQLSLRSTARVRVESSAGYSPTVGNDFKVYEDGTLVFGGLITSVTRARVAGTSVISSDIAAVDYSILANKRLTGERYGSSGYVNQRANDILRDLVANCLGGDGIDVSLIPAGGGPIVSLAEFDYAYVSEAFDRIAELSERKWRIDFEKKLRLVNPAAPVIFATLTASSRNFLADSMQVEETQEQYLTKLVVRGKRTTLPEATETFNSSHPSQPTNGTRKDWNLTNPVFAVPTIEVNGTAKTVGVASVDTGKDWYWRPSSAVIEQDNAAAALTASDTLSVAYVGEQLNQAFSQNSAEISARAAVESSSGIWEKAIELDNPISVSDLQQYADSTRQSKDQLSKKLIFATDDLAGIFPGDGIDLTISSLGAHTYIVTSLQLSMQTLGTATPGTNNQRIVRRIEAQYGPILDNGFDYFKAISVSGASSASGGAVTGGGGPSTPPAENVATAAATPFYNGDRWGIDLTVTFGTSRANIARAVVYVRGPIGGESIDREAYSFVPPPSGNYDALLGGEWLRGGASTNFRVIIETYNSEGVPTASPIESSIFAVLPVDTANQATAITVGTFTTTANADGLEVFGFTLTYTQANLDTSHTEIWIQSFDSATSAYRTEQLYNQTAPGGSTNGFVVTGRGEWIDATPSSARNYRLTFYTIDTRGQRKPNAPQIVVSVSPGAGALKLNRADLATVGDALTVSGGRLIVADNGITSAKIQALAVTTAKLADSAVDTAKLANLAVDAAKLANSSVTATKIANAAVGSAAIANLAVGNAAIADGAITNAKIQDASITSAKIASLAAEKITTGTITVGAGGMTFSGGGGISINTGAAITTINSSGVVAPNLFASVNGFNWSVVGGFSGFIDYTPGMAGYVNTPQLRVSNTQTIDGSRNANFSGLRFSGNFQPPISTLSPLSVPTTYNRGLAVFDNSGFFFGWIPIFF
jgi:hypothetical protein